MSSLDPNAAPQNSPRGQLITPRKKAGFHASVMWTGENALGAIPLLAYLLTHRYRNPQLVYLCPPSAGQNSPLSLCNYVPESVIQELCILTVVIAGLAVLSFFHLGPRARKAQPTALTYSLVVISMIVLIAGAILYAMASSYQIQAADFVTNGILVAAVLSSYFLRIEEAILDA